MQCQSTICLNTAKITKKQEAVFEILQRWTSITSDSLSSNFESCKCNTSIKGNTYDIGAGEAGYDANKVPKNETEIVVPLKHLSNFFRTWSIPLINCEIKLILTWSKNCVLADMTVTAAGNNNDPPAIVAPTGLEFQIKDTKLYIPVVTLSTENDKKLLEQLKEL